MTRGSLVGVLALVAATVFGKELCQDVRVHDFHGDQEGYGNQLHALVLGAEMAKSCGLNLTIPYAGRFGHICSRLGCDAPWVNRRDFVAPPASFEVVYQRGFGARCQVHKMQDCRLRDESCLTRLQTSQRWQFDAMREVLDVSRPPLTPTCTDGAAAPSAYDVVVHFRAITTEFEGRDEAQFRLGRNEFKAHQEERPDDRVAVDDRVLRLPPFQELVAPITSYMREAAVRRTIFLAGNIASVKDLIAERFEAAGVVVCQIRAESDLIRHPQAIGNDQGRFDRDASFCTDCLDVTFSEWSALATAKALVAQIGMHCVGNGTCVDPRERILGRRSSFSLTAATYAQVRSTIILGEADLDPKTFTPPGFRPPTGLAHSCSPLPAVLAYESPRVG